MKRAIFFLTILCILFGCKKEGGKLVCTMTYNTSDNTTYNIPKKKNVGNNTMSNNEIINDRYTQFGDFITSITPSRFVGKFMELQFFEETSFRIPLIDWNWDLADPRRLADFSNNGTVSFTPQEVNVRNNMVLTYLSVKWCFLYQEWELPKQYENFHDDQLQFFYLGNVFNNTFDGFYIGMSKTGCFVKGGQEELVAPIFDENWTGFTGTYPAGCRDFLFGNTDSIYILEEGTEGHYIAKINKYNPVTISAIPDGETKTIMGTMSFNTTDLIQIYAGKDNIPYTKDDYFVYAPKFWERISVTLESY